VANKFGTFQNWRAANTNVVVLSLLGKVGQISAAQIAVTHQGNSRKDQVIAFSLKQTYRQTTGNKTHPNHLKSCENRIHIIGKYLKITAINEITSN